jgi:hypothetical protein
VARLPLHRRVLAWNNKAHFPEILADRWVYYLEQNGLTPIAPLSHRLDLVSRLDLRPLLPEIRTEILLLQGNEDRIVPRRHFDELRAGLPNATGVIMPLVGHQPHYTHAEALAQAIGDFLLPCAPGALPGGARIAGRATARLVEPPPVFSTCADITCPPSFREGGQGGATRRGPTPAISRGEVGERPTIA